MVIQLTFLGPENLPENVPQNLPENLPENLPQSVLSEIGLQLIHTYEEMKYFGEISYTLGRFGERFRERYWGRF